MALCHSFWNWLFFNIHSYIKITLRSSFTIRRGLSSFSLEALNLLPKISKPRQADFRPLIKTINIFGYVSYKPVYGTGLRISYTCDCPMVPGLPPPGSSCWGRRWQSPPPPSFIKVTSANWFFLNVKLWLFFYGFSSPFWYFSEVFIDFAKQWPKPTLSENLKKKNCEN